MIPGGGNLRSNLTLRVGSVVPSDFNKVVLKLTPEQKMAIGRVAGKFPDQIEFNRMDLTGSSRALGWIGDNG